MATYYFRDTVDTDWDNGNNWWDAPSGGSSGSVPTSSDDVIIKALVDTSSIVGSPSVNDMTIDSGGVLAALSVTVAVNCYIQNGGRLASGTLTGNVICSFGGVVGWASNSTGGPTITGNLDFLDTGSTDADSGYGITVNSDTLFGSNWTGSASYITAGNFNYYYGYSGTTSNLTTSGNTLYFLYPTLYYNNATNDGDFGNSNNWWVDASYTQKSGNYPYSNNILYINGSVTSDSAYSGTLTVDTVYFTGGGTVAIDFNITNDAIFTDVQYGDGSSSITLIANNVYFNAPTGTYVIANYATISFGNECILTGYAVNDGIISANGYSTGSTYFNDNSINNGTVGVPATSYTVDFNDNATNTGTVEIATNANYPLNRNTFNTGTINGSITYVGYPSNFYFYGGTDWNNTSYWWTGSLGTGDNAGYVPGALDTVIIQAAPSTTANDVYAYNMTIDGPAFILANNSYTVYVTSLTVENGSVGDGMTGTNISANTASFNNTSTISTGSNLTVSTSCIFYLNSDINGGTITGEVHFNDTSTFSSGTITGNAYVEFPHPVPFTVGGTLTGSLVYSGYSPRTIYFDATSSPYPNDWSYIGNWWDDANRTTQALYVPNSAVSLDDVIVNAGSITTNSLSLDTTIGSLTVNNGSDISINITCNTATFNNNSVMGGMNTSAVLTQTNDPSNTSITFSDLSINQGYITAGTPPVVFEDSSDNNGYITGDMYVYYPVVLPVALPITGNITYFGYSYYFNDAQNANNDGNWATSNNWFLDSGSTTAAGGPPTDTMPGENVILQTSVSNNAGGFITPTANNLTCGGLLSISGITITVYGTATFQDDGYLGSGGIINGDALFKNNATCQGGTVNNIATFTLSSAATMIYNGYDGTYGSSVADIAFEYGKGVNGSSILGIV